MATPDTLTEELVTRSKGIDGHVNQGMDSLAFGDTQVTGHGESSRVVLRVKEVAGRVADSGNSFMVVVDTEILALVREVRPAMGDGVSWLPSNGEAGSVGSVEDGLVVGHNILGNDVAGETRVLVSADGVSFGSVRVLGIEEFWA
jgi:hypothetical protein